jgi:hypothetical protein
MSAIERTSVLLFFIFFMEGLCDRRGGRNARGRRGDVEVDQKEGLNSIATHCLSPTIIEAKRKANSIILTFRVDSCSKHLLAAPLIVQNVDAWKSNRNCR